MSKIVHEPKPDEAEVNALLDRVFGPDRLNLTAYRLREGVSHEPELSFAAYDADRLIGTLRFWPVQLRARDRVVPLLLLGPIAVDPDFAGQGIGLEMIETGIARATALGHDLVLLIGDLPYYSRAGFSREGAERIELPGPVDRNRVLIRELRAGAAESLTGMLEPAGKADQQAEAAQRASGEF